MSLVKDSYLLKGHVDLIRGEGDTVEISRLTSNQNRSLTSLANGRRWSVTAVNWRSMHTSSRGAQDTRLVSCTSTTRERTTGNPYISFDKDAHSIDQTIKAFDGIVERIENKDFDNALHALRKYVRNCALKPYCDANVMKVEGWYKVVYIKQGGISLGNTIRT